MVGLSLGPYKSAGLLEMLFFSRLLEGKSKVDWYSHAHLKRTSSPKVGGVS